IVTASIAVLLCGCGTMNNSIMMFYHQPPEHPPNDYQPPNWVYGGVKWDAESARCSWTTKEDFPANLIVALLYTADVPLSAVFDTLNLPATIPATKREADRWRDVRDTKDGELDDAASLRSPAVSRDSARLLTSRLPAPTPQRVSFRYARR